MGVKNRKVYLIRYLILGLKIKIWGLYDGSFNKRRKRLRGIVPELGGKYGKTFVRNKGIR